MKYAFEITQTILSMEVAIWNLRTNEWFFFLNISKITDIADVNANRNCNVKINIWDRKGYNRNRTFRIVVLLL